MRRRIHVDTDIPEEDAPAGAHAESGDQAPVPLSERAELEELRTRVGELETQVSQLEQQAAQERDRYMRTLADFQNFRRRSEEQRTEIHQFANREMILALLPILDNFERAMAAAEANKSYEALIGGVGLTLRQLHDFLKAQGVEPIDSVGEEFNPECHEAVARVDDSERPDNTVVDEVRKGYKMHSRVLRPSMVKVARG